MDKMDSSSLDITKLNIEKIKELFPNVVTEDKIDFDVLRNVLGDEVDDSKEKYQFTWKGKSAAIKIAQMPSTTTLRPSKEDSKDWDTTENLYIEGDNLEVLKQLQKTYYGKIKMIYIDPPYNTGNDFVYKDDFKDSIENYKEQTNQTGKSNPETNGRYHTDWLNMMYPRLLLSKNLLEEQGIICISIDNNEYENLKKIISEIFGECNFICSYIWQKSFAPKNDNKYISNSHEYIVVYAKNKDKYDRKLIPRSTENLKSYTNPDNDERGIWTSGTCLVSTFSSSSVFPISNPQGKEVFPPEGRCWRYNKETFEQLKKDNRIWWGQNGDGVPRVKRFLSEMPDGIVPQSLLKYEVVGSGQDGTQECKSLFENCQLFDFPKPTKLIQYLIDRVKGENFTVLDFFSGSSTTAQAVFKQNIDRTINLKFIMVQLPEIVTLNSSKFYNFNNICDLAKERICRAGEKIKDEWLKDNANEGLFAEEQKEFPFDIGFKVFKLDSTNIYPWDNELEMDEKTLFKHTNDVFKQNRSKEDILYEILLKYGVFDMNVSEIDINGKKMYQVGRRYMLVCLENVISNDDIKSIIEQSPKIVVFKESGFKNDNDKINAIYNLEKAGVEDIKCI